MKKTLQIISFLCVIFPSYSQHYNFKNYNLEDGLPQATVYNLFQDHKGFLWIGTQGGVSKFNGIEFLNFNQKDGLAGNHVTEICQDKKKNIWLGHRYGGLTCVNENKIINSKVSKKESTVLSITKWKNGIISIIRPKDSLSKIYYSFYKDNIIKHSKIDIKDSSRKFKLKSKDQELYIATNKGLQILSSDLTLKNTILEGEHIKDFDWDENGSLYVLTINGLKIISNDHIEKDIIIDNSYDQLIACKSNQLWLCNEKSALSIIGDKKQYINSKNGLVKGVIHCILEDNEGNIWIGLHGTGLSQLVPANFETFDESDGIINDQIATICMDHNSRLWTSGEHTIDILEFHENSNFSLKNVLHLSDYIDIEFETVNYIFQDSRLLIWIGTDNGVYIMDSELNLINHFREADGLSNNHINSINEDDENNIWLSSRVRGITKISVNNGTYSFKVFDKSNGLCSNKFWTVFVDSKGIVYFGSDDAGISYWNGSEFNVINTGQGLLNLRAGSITEDSQNNLWIGTIGGGIFKYNGSKCIQYSSEDGLSSDNPYLVIADNIGNVWVGTNTGLDFMPISSIPDSNNRKNLFKHYGFNQGFLGIECNQNAKCKDYKGNLWFGTINGIVQCNSEEIREDTTPPRIHITGKKLFLKDNIALSNNILKYNENHMTFEFIGLHFTNPHQVKYQYKLENFDKDWSPWSKSTSATYSYLLPGKYNFTLKAANGDHYESEIISYEFEILPPFWNTIWFYILCSTLIVIIYVLIIRLRTIKIEKDKKILEKKVDQRTKELNDEKQIVINQKEIIETKNKNITASINYAKTIQESVLPDTKILKNYFSDSFIYYKPRDIVSGDFYWFKKRGDYFIIAAADCTGHGIPGAFLSMLGSELLNQIAINPEINKPSQAINLLDEGIYNALNKNKNNFQHNGIDISICVFNKNDNYFNFSGARRPILVNRKNEIKIYEATSCSIGEFKDRNEQPFDSKIEIKKGDRIYMFSDGYVDQFGGPKNKKFLIKRFIDLIKETQEISLENQKNIFDETLINWTKDNEQVDDILLMGVEI